MNDRFEDDECKHPDCKEWFHYCKRCEHDSKEVYPLSLGYCCWNCLDTSGEVFPLAGKDEVRLETLVKLILGIEDLDKRSSVMEIAVRLFPDLADALNQKVLGSI